MGPNRALFFIFPLKNVSRFYIFNGNKKGEIMKQQYLWAKIAIVAALSAASSAAWAGNCYFTGGHYDASPDTNTLYLESFAVEGSEVVFDQTTVNCLKQNVPSNGATVVIKRDTPLKKNSTLVLPFPARLDPLCFKVYEVNDFNNSSGEWKIMAGNPGTDVQMNKPYIMIVDTDNGVCQDLREITLTVSTNSFRALDGHEYLRQYVSNTQGSPFYLVGTYKYIKWESGASGIDKVYGYAAKDKNGASGGQFVKIGAGAYLPPLRAYLEYQGSGLAKKSSSNIDDFKLPETIEVQLIDGDSTLSIGKLNPVTGEIQMDSRRFDLNGRAINGKPANHGVYVGKQKVVR